MAVDCDLLLKGGLVIDPYQDLHEKRDLAFKDGKVLAMSETLPTTRATKVVDVSGKLVLPGLIDLHGHFNYKMSAYHADADVECLPFGVTTAVDTGSTGWMSFPAFRSYVIEKVSTRLLAYVHLSSVGTMPVAIQVPDLGDFRYARLEETIQCIEENRDIVLGVKVRLSPTGTMLKNAVPALEMAREVADKTGTRVMIHVMESPLPLGDVFRYLKSGDVVTHIFHGDTHNVLKANGTVRPEVWRAYEDGVIFDTGSAMRHFSIPICRSAVDQGLTPHTISTDRVGPKPGRVNYSILAHMSMFLHLGMSLDGVVKSVTSGAASAIGRSDIGNLLVGSVGDAAVLELREGNYKFEDQLGGELTSELNFEPYITIKDGKLWELV